MFGPWRRVAFVARSREPDTRIRFHTWFNTVLSTAWSRVGSRLMDGWNACWQKAASFGSIHEITANLFSEVQLLQNLLTWRYLPINPLTAC